MLVGTGGNVNIELDPTKRVNFSSTLIVSSEEPKRDHTKFSGKNFFILFLVHCGGLKHSILEKCCCVPVVVTCHNKFENT